MTLGFERKHRITQRKQFEQIYKTGRRLQSPYFRLYLTKNTSEIPQIGISITKRVGNAVTRNRLKRLIREWFRTHRESLPGIALIVQAKPDAVGLEFSDVVEQLNRLIDSANRH